jgi:hypothetical protein
MRWLDTQPKQVITARRRSWTQKLCLLKLRMFTGCGNVINMLPLVVLGILGSTCGHTTNVRTDRAHVDVLHRHTPSGHADTTHRDASRSTRHAWPGLATTPLAPRESRQIANHGGCDIFKFLRKSLQASKGSLRACHRRAVHGSAGRQRQPLPTKATLFI